MSALTGAITLNTVAASLQACGGSDESPAPSPPGTTDTTAPVVTAVFPANGAETSDLATQILVTFSEAVDASTVTPASFRATEAGGGANVTGSITVSGNTATFTPATALQPGKQYQFRITAAIRDIAGNALPADFSWAFSTSATAVLPTAGTHGLSYKNDGPLGSSIVVDLGTTAATRSTLVACVGRGVIGSHRAPTDNMGNLFVQADSTHAYIPRWPNSGTALYIAETATGGPNHAVTADNSVTPTDEVTVAVVEVRNGGGVTTRWNQVQSGDPVQSQSIVTTGPATLVAFWWGDADGSVAHAAVPGNGFVRIDTALAAGSLVQCAVAVREVQSAGTYSVSWTATPQQGAQLWLVAVQ